MNNFSHMLKIIPLCSATHRMGLIREKNIACEQGHFLRFLGLFNFLPLVLLLFLFVCFFLSSRCDINFVRERSEKVTTADPGVEVPTPPSVSEQTSRGFSLLSFSCSPHFLLLLFS